MRLVDEQSPALESEEPGDGNERHKSRHWPAGCAMAETQQNGAKITKGKQEMNENDIEGAEEWDPADDDIGAMFDPDDGYDPEDVYNVDVDDFCSRCVGDGSINYFDASELWGEDCPGEKDHLVVCPDCLGRGFIPATFVDDKAIKGNQQK